MLSLRCVAGENVSLKGKQVTRMWMVTGGPGEGGAHVTRAVEEDLRRECASVTILRKLFHKKKKTIQLFT